MENQAIVHQQQRPGTANSVERNATRVRGAVALTTAHMQDIIEQGTSMTCYLCGGGTMIQWGGGTGQTVNAGGEGGGCFGSFFGSLGY